MLNVKTLTDTLSRMELPQLQQYAALHKNDPYVVAMALSIANQKKQMSAAQAGQAGMQPQPKVVDQQIAGMAQQMPEDMGIGALPAPNMQSMAEGGIVAFDEGGEVRHFDGQTGSYTGRPTGGLLGDIPGYVPGATSFGLPQAGVEDPNSLTTLEKLKRWNERGIAERKLREVNAARAQAGLAPVTQTGSPPIAAAPAVPTAPTVAAPAAAAPAVAAKNKSPLAALVNKPAAPGVSAAPAAPGIATTPDAVAAEMEGIQKRQKTENPFAKQIEDLTAAERDTLTKEKAQFEADIAKTGPAFQEREERLKKRGEKLTAQEDRLPYMALMEAGLAIMAGTSPNALTNIGAGSAVGLKSYSAGIDKLTDARDKLDDAFGKIEEFRRNEDNMNAKEKRAMQKSIDNTYTEAKKLGLAALQKDWELDRTEATKQFDVLSRNRQTVFEQGEATKRTDMEQRGANARTKMQLGAPPAEARMALMLGTGKTEAERLESGLKKMQEVTSDKTGMAAVKLLTETNAKRETAMLPPLTMDELLTSAKEYQTLMYPKVVKTNPTAQTPVYGR